MHYKITSVQMRLFSSVFLFTCILEFKKFQNKKINLVAILEKFA